MMTPSYSSHRSTLPKERHPSAFGVAQQARQQRRRRQRLEQVLPFVEKGYHLTRYLYQRLLGCGFHPAHLKRWLLEQVARLSRRLHLRRLSRSEWLALGLATGLTLNSLSQPLLVLAQEPLGDEFQVNTYTPDRQNNPSVGMDADGDFVVVWTSLYQDGDDRFGIFAQRYSAAGTPQGSEFRVNTTTTNDHFSPSVGMDADGDFVVAWTSFPQDGSDTGIYAQRYNAAGTPQGSEFRVNTTTTSGQSSPSVGLDADGDFVVAWDSYEDGSGSGIFAQRYDANGTPQGSEFQVNTYTAGRQGNPSVGLGTDGDFVVAWESGSLFNVGQDGSDTGIYAQRYNADGTPQGSEFRVNIYTTGSQFFPSVGLDAEGDFVIAWTSDTYDDATQQDGSRASVYARRYNAEGTPQSSEFRINTYTTGWQNFPSVGLDAEGDFVVAWQSSNQDGSFDGIFAQRYNAGGTPQGSEFQVNSYTSLFQFAPSVGIDADGDFVIAWESYQDGDYSGIYAQRYGSPNIGISGNGHAISDGDSTPSSTNDTDFGNLVVGSGSLTRTFTISNTGLAELTLGTVAISGTHASDFSVAQQPITPVAANSSTAFQITFSPSAAGLRTAEVSLSNNDSDETPYTFAIQGTGVEEGTSVYLPLVIKQ